MRVGGAVDGKGGMRETVFVFMEVTKMELSARMARFSRKVGTGNVAIVVKVAIVIDFQSKW